MKRILIGMTLLILLLGACVPKAQPTEPQSPQSNPDSYPNDSYPNNSYPNGGGSSSQIPMDLTPAQRAALADLSGTLGLPADQIKLISTEAVTWPDGCLGVTRMGMMCTQNTVAGFRIVLEANSKQYEYHTNQDGTSIIQAVLSTDSTSAEDMVRGQLASNLGIDKNKISVVSDATIEFPDSCMGVAMENVMCSQVITPGRIIVLESNGTQYEYHTNDNGTMIQPATLALTWRRDGGIAGFCDNITVFLSGEIYGNQCKSQPNETMKTFTAILSSKEQQQLTTWLKDFGQVNVDASDPQGVSDRMTVTLALYGSGTAATVATSDKEALLLWAQTVFQKLYN